MERFAPVLPVYAAAGGAGERKQLLEQAAREKKGVIITSYELLRRDIDIYTGMDFACEVIDEAQFIKNHSTQAARACLLYTSYAAKAGIGPIAHRF